MGHERRRFCQKFVVGAYFSGLTNYSVCDQLRYNIYRRMEAIYEAILLIPQSPAQATKILSKLSRSQPKFIALLKTMAIQLYSRFCPQSQVQHHQYQIICKQMLAILNRFLNLQFQEKGNDVYLMVEDYYRWIIEVLLAENIPLSCKKSLSTAFTKILESICYKPKRIVELIQHMMENSIGPSSCLFLYMESLLKAKLSITNKIESIKQSYQLLFYTAICEYKSLVGFYQNEHMEVDAAEIVTNNLFLQRLKQHQFMLATLVKMFQLIENAFASHQNYEGLVNFSADLFFHPDLAKFISSVLKIEQDLFNTQNKPNLYGLKMIIVTNLRPQERNVINNQKSHCLTILKIILTLTDKAFNIECTDKLLMKELRSLAEVIINQLFICSGREVLSTLSIQLEIVDFISSMFGLLSVLVQFQDLKASFESLTIQTLIRLTFFYTQTFQEEQKIYEDHAQEYFHFSYYICDQPMNEPELDCQIDELGEFFIKRKAVMFLKEMSNKIGGFHSIAMDICCDIIKLETELKIDNRREYREMFKEKYRLGEDIFSCISMESALFVFTILVQRSWQHHQKLKRMHFILTNIDLNRLNHLQLYRLYTCLAVNSSLFYMHKGHMHYYHFIQKVYRLENKTCSVTQAGYYFLQKLITNYKDGGKIYDIFIQKLLNQLVEEFKDAHSFYPFDTVRDAIKVKYVAEQIICLDWVNRTLEALNARIETFRERNHSCDELFNIILQLYHAVMEHGQAKINENRNLPYPSFQQECIAYHQIVCQLISQRVFTPFQRILKQKQVTEEDQTLIVSYCSLIHRIFTQEINLSDPQISIILTFTLTLLARRDNFSQKVQKSIFHLLYQLINIKVFTLDEQAYSSILNWMKTSYYQSQVSLNRVCIILQELYYNIDGNLNQNTDNFLQFFSTIIQILEKKFLEYLFEYHNYVQVLEEEMDVDIKRINELKINFDPSVQVKTNPVTIVRLYNTILLNPYFDITIIRKIHEMIKKYNYEIVPTYDLTVQVLALQSLIKRTNNISVIECFRFTTELLGYNCKHPQQACKKNTAVETEIVELTQQLRSPITQIDPYEAYCLLIQRQVFNPDQANLSVTDTIIDQIQISILDFLQNDKYMMNLVKKLTHVRNVNKKTRMIVKIKKKEYQQ